MKRKNNESSMNFWSFLDKNKYILITTLLLIFVIIIFRGYSIDTPYFKLGKVPDTLFIEKPMTVVPETIYQEKMIDPEKPKLVSIERTNAKTKLKQGDTIIEVTNQPANINTGVNHGIIGNDNQVNVNVKEVQRQLDEPLKARLLHLVNEKIKVKNLNKNVCVQISSIANNESFNFAKQIERFLKSQGYNTTGAIGTFQRSPPIVGAEVGFEQNCVSINVGFKP